MSKKNCYLIFGAQMVNKGAQAMLFITASEIRRRDPEAEIVVFIYEKWKSEESPDIYRMRFVPITMKHIMNLSHTLLSKAYLTAKRGKLKKEDPSLREIDEILQNAVMAFDISGYALSNQWGVNSSVFFLSKFALLHQYHIPTYVLPQSFGPMDYHSAVKTALVKHYTKKYLAYPEIVFAREQEGYDCLTQEIGLANVRLSNDLVLQSSSVELKAIYRQPPDFRQIKTKSANCVAIIPNSSNERYGDREQIYRLYGQLIEKLSEKGKQIYLLAHSSQDLEVCRTIAAQAGDRENITLVEADLNCIEYGMFIRQFDYVIASRFHSIVNAFKEHIPCIALGWAVKYKELLELLGQKQFNFDVRKPESFGELLTAVDNMEESCQEQSSVIAEKLKAIQENSCFQFLDQIKK